MFCCVAVVLCMAGCSRHAKREANYAERSSDGHGPVRTELTQSSKPIPDAVVTINSLADAGRPSPFADGQKPEPAPSAPAGEPTKAAAVSKKQRKPFAVSKLFETTGRPASTKAVDLPPPPAITPPAAPRISLPGSSPRICCSATAMYEPVKTPRLQRVIQRVPGLRRLGRNTESEEDLTPPHPLHDIRWAVPFGSNASGSGSHHVSLKADIDESGGVTRVELLAPKDEDLLARAADAAAGWKFTPARVNDKAVASQIILHFWFEDR